jgi:hypothetical protein
VLDRFTEASSVTPFKPFTVTVPPSSEEISIVGLVLGSGLRVQGVGFRVEGFGLSVEGWGFRVVILGFKVQNLKMSERTFAALP